MWTRDKIVSIFVPASLLIVVGLGVFLRFSFVFHKNLWIDESLTFQHSQISLHDLLLQQNAYWDYNHPPGYFILIKFLSLFNTSEFFLRLPSVFFYVVGAIFLKKITDFFKSKYITLFLLIYYSFHPLIVQLGTEIKMYSIVIGADLIIIYLFFKFFHNKESALLVNGLILLPALSFYIDYSAIWIIVTITAMTLVLMLIRHPKRKVLLKIMTFISLFIIPQIIVLMTHLDEIKFLTTTQHSSGDLRRYGLGLFNMFTGLAHWGWEFGQFQIVTFNPFSGSMVKEHALAISLMISFILFEPLIAMLFFTYKSYASKVKKFPIYLITLFGMSLALIIPTIFYLAGQNLFHVRNQIQVSLFMIVAFGLILERFRHSFTMKLVSGVFLTIALGSFFLAIRNDYFKPEINWREVRREAESGCKVVYFGQPPQDITPFHEMSPFIDYYSKYPYSIFSEVKMVGSTKQVDTLDNFDDSSCTLVFVSSPADENLMTNYCQQRHCKKYYFY